MRRRHTSTHYWSDSSKAPIRIAEMPVPHAENALAKLIRLHGEKARETPVGRALQRRIGQAEVIVTEVSPRPGVYMLRHRATGRFAGKARVTVRRIAA